MFHHPLPQINWAITAMNEMAEFTMSDCTIEAVRATIHLGDIPIEVFLLASGEYRLSQTQVAEAVEKDEVSFRKFLVSKSPQALPYKTFRAEKLKVDDTKTKINAIPVDMASAYWLKEAIAGNLVAAQLAGACLSESVERRADTVFGVQRSESERQAFMEARLKGKVTRRCLMDAIAAYKLRHPELSENTKQWLYSNVSEAVNLQIFSRRANKLCKDFGVQKTQLREAMNAQELLLVQEVEDVAMRLIDSQDIHPLQAVKDAAARLLIPKQTRVLAN